jgi:peroxiredoxin
MVANIFLLTCALFTAQPGDRTEWLLLPRLQRGQELVYRGTFTEEGLGQGVQFNRAYRLESRIFVLNTLAGGLDVALYTVLSLRMHRPERKLEPEPSSVRLELASISLQGKITSDPDVSLLVPLDGPITIESSAFVELPNGRVHSGQQWEASEGKRPPHFWKMVGTEMINNTRCLKLEGLQQSPDWDHPRADSTAWRRRDIVWLDPNLGVAYKVERLIERREPAHRDLRQRLLAQYELQTNIQYPANLFEQRQREIVQAKKFYESIAPLLPNPTKYGRAPFDVMLAKIDQYEKNQPRTPYREAVLQVKRRVEAARRGDSPPRALPEESEAPALVASIGQRAPDFAATNLLTKETLHLQRWQGRPVLLVFFSPNSLSAEEVLRFGQTLQTTHGEKVAVLGLAISDDLERIRKQAKEFHLSYPIVSGKGMRQSYAVEATPKFVILDADGIVRGNYVGWGPETSEAIAEEIRSCLRSEIRFKSPAGAKRVGSDDHKARP